MPKPPLNYICLNCRQGIFGPRTNKKFCCNLCRYQFNNRANPIIKRLVYVRTHSIPKSNRVRSSTRGTIGIKSSHNDDKNELIDKNQVSIVKTRKEAEEGYY